MSRHSLSRRGIRARLTLGALALTVVAACSSSGGSCAGCNTETIPGGFPAAKTFERAMMAQVSETGLTFLEQNIGALVAGFMPNGLSFDIPATGCNDPKATMQMCCGTGLTCKATAEITSAKLDPKKPNKLSATISAAAWTGTGTLSKKTISKLPVNVTFLGVSVKCDMVLDATKGANKSLGITTTVTFDVAKTAPKKTTLSVSGTDLKDLEAADITVSGANALCAGFNALLQTPGVLQQLMPLFKSSLITPIESELKKQLAAQALGQEGRLDLGAAMAAFSPSTTGKLDYLVWAGGYAEAQEKPKGLSLGVLGGFEPATVSDCVPDCEATGATCAPPTVETIGRSTALESGKDAAGKAYHLGVGIHRYTLHRAGYALYRSGALCLELGTATSAMISSGTFALFLPSLKTLTEGKNVPVTLALRPQKPPTFTLGEGTYTTDSSGKPTIKDPLLTLTLPDLAIDFYVLGDERYIRVFRVTGDLAIPLLLFPDGKGKLQPVIGDLSTAFTKLKVTSNELISEDSTKISGLIPTLIGLATSFIGDAIKPIDIPAIQGLELQLGPGSITSIDKDSAGKYKLLALFAKLTKAKTTSLPLPATPAPGEPEVELQTLARVAQVLPADPGALHTTPPRPELSPSVVVDLQAVLPPAMAGQAVEYTYKLDGGFFRPWTTGPRLLLRDPLLWLAGAHRLEVAARIKGASETLDSTPAQVSFNISSDHLAPAAPAEVTGACTLGGPGQGRSLAPLPLMLLCLVLVRRRR